MSSLFSSLILVAGLSCPKPVILNKTAYEWNEYDNFVLKLAKIRCGFKYKNSPCLVQFIKVGKKDYHALCGAKRQYNED